MALSINLLQNQKDYNTLDNYFKIWRIVVVVTGATCLVSMLVILGLRTQLQNSVDATVQQRNQIVQQVNDLTDLEAQVILIDTKVRAIDEIIAESPDYAQQVETFYAFFPQASGSAQMSNLIVNEDVSTITFKVPNTLALTSFLSTVESDVFLDTFDSVELGSIDLAGKDGTYNVTLDVKYKGKEAL